MSTVKRLLKELDEVNSRIRDTEDDVVSVVVDENNLMEWRATLRGPVDTPFDGGEFVVSLVVPDNYPFKAPKAKFLTPIFHPNVHFESGEICLDILKQEWTPAWSLLAVCQAIVSLLANPEPDSPLNCDCGNLLRAGDERGYNSLARYYTDMFAAPSDRLG